jgi:hypothetical protein
MSLLYYYERETDAYPRGIVDLELYTDAQRVEGQADTFTLKAPQSDGTRIYTFTSESESAAEGWLDALDTSRHAYMRDRLAMSLASSGPQMEELEAVHRKLARASQQNGRTESQLMGLLQIVLQQQKVQQQEEKEEEEEQRAEELAEELRVRKSSGEDAEAGGGAGDGASASNASDFGLDRMEPDKPTDITDMRKSTIAQDFWAQQSMDEIFEQLQDIVTAGYAQSCESLARERSATLTGLCT